MQSAFEDRGTHQEVSPAADHVFVAEDDDELRDSLVEILSAAGYQVWATGDGESLLDLVSASLRRRLPPPSLVVSDIRMPKMRGTSAVEVLRSCGMDVPVVLITGFGGNGGREAGVAAGADVVLDKPFDAADLLGVVEATLSARRGGAS